MFSGATSGLILQPPTYLVTEPPSYDESLASIASSEVGHENQAFYPQLHTTTTSIQGDYADENSVNERLEKPPL